MSSEQSRLWVHLDIEAIITSSQEVEQWRITLSDITLQKKAEKAQKQREQLQRLEAQAQRERLLNHVSSAIRQSLELEKIVERTVKEVLQAFSVSRVLLVIYDEQKTIDLTRVASAKEETEDAIALWGTIGDYSQVRQWFQEDQIFAVDDVNTEGELSLRLGLTTEGKARSMLVAGICYEETLHGVLCLQMDDRAHKLTSEEKQLLRQISDQLAIALQQARMYQTLQKALEEQAKLKQQLNYDANHDQLTGLPNRKHFIDHIKEAIQRSQTEQVGFAVLFLDLNGFKQVNDTFGHTVGDELLKIVGERLQNCLREEDLLARFGGG